MPIPTPEKDEERSSFMSRCVSFLVKEGKSSDQASAICYDKWNNKNSSSKKSDKGENDAEGT
jgi:hypothetical protein